MTVTLYVYNNGLDVIPSDIDDGFVRKHFRQVISEVSSFRASQDTSVDFSASIERTSTFEGCGPQFVFKSFEIETPQAVFSSHAYLTVQNNHFIKLRISYIRGDEALAAEAQSFIKELRKIIGKCSS